MVSPTAESASGPARRSYPLHVHIATLFSALMLVTGAGLSAYHFHQARRVAIEATEDIFARTVRETMSGMERLVAPVRTLVELLSFQPLIHARTLTRRMDSIGFLCEALDQHPHVAAVYIGYRDGDFFLVRPIRDPAAKEAFGAPGGAAYLVQSVERDASGAPRGRFVFLDERAKVLQTEDRDQYRFDPRSRPWYELAAASGELVRTDPYVFYTTGETGFTFARLSADGAAVAAADVTLSRVSHALAAAKTTPSTELAVLDFQGRLLAYADPDRLARTLKARGDKADLAKASDLGVTILARAERLLAQGEVGKSRVLEDGNREWYVQLASAAARYGTEIFLLVAIPLDELLAGARRTRNETLLATVVIILLSVPLTWWLARRIGAQLEKLTREAQEIRRFRFDTPDAGGSPVWEVDELSRTMAQMKRSIRNFLDIAAALSAERHFDRLLDRIVGEALSAAGAEVGIVYLLDAATGTLKPAALRRKSGPDSVSAIPGVGPIGAKTAHPICAAAREGGTAIGRLSSPLPEGLSFIEADFGSGGVFLATIPLRDRAGEVIGALCLFLPVAAGAPSQERMAFVEALSGAAAVAIHNQRLLQAQKDLMESLIKVLAGAIDAKSPYTGGHCERVPELTKMLARAACEAKEGPFAAFSMDEDEWETLHIAGWLHDCGKVTTPEFVVDKATKLEAIYDRIHEIRMRFEVLKRDAELAYWKAVAQGGDPGSLREKLEAAWRTLDEEFAFVAACNEGGEFMAPEKIERLNAISARTWQRTLDDRLGTSWEERQRKERSPAPQLPATEALLADKPEHVVARGPGDRMPDDNPWGFRLRVPEHKYNRGELYNLAIGRGTLTEEDRYTINDHIVQTIVMLSKLPFPGHLARVPEMAGGHHEKMDGTGYPRRVRREQMSVQARMMAIADIFEALTAADRPYKKGKKLSEAIKIMSFMKKDQHVDAEIFDLFLTSGVYRQYAERFVKPEQIDDVDIRPFLSGGG